MNFAQARPAGWRVDEYGGVPFGVEVGLNGAQGTRWRRWRVVAERPHVARDEKRGETSTC